jgi:hypothetical protein
MKRIKLFMPVLVLTIFSSILASAQKDDFNGTWRLNPGKSTLAEYTPVLTRINVRITGDSLLTERYYDTGEGQEYPFTENVTLDGKEHSITIYEMPRKTKALWSENDGTLVVESVTTFTGDMGTQDFVSKEAWKVDKINNTITISFTNKVGDMGSEGAFILNKAIPGQ